MKRLKKIWLILLSTMTLFFVFVIWYSYIYSMDKAKPFQLKFPNLDSKLLIATQGSDFKNTLTNGIVDYFKSDSIFIKVIDVSSLDEVNPVYYDAITVIHTWENWKPPSAVKMFLERTSKYKDQIIVLTTSGEGTYKIEEVDAITGESIWDDVPLLVDKIIEKLDPILKLNTVR
ncbi:MAG: hypothetical protein KAJ23_07915 [Maribacter sp.]|nr:hypothetical protein [Maribacter sp.]